MPSANHIVPRYSPQIFDKFVIMAEAFLTGAYTVLVGFIVWVLITNYCSMSKTHRILFGASIVMFAIAVVHLALLMHTATVGRLSPQVVGAASALGLVQFTISDSMLIWRVWVLWQRKYWIIILPLSLLASAIGTMCYSTFMFVNAHGLPTPSLLPIVFIAANTCVCMGLIVWRIRSAKSTTSLQRFPRGAALLVESGALYAASQVIILILYFTNVDGLTIMINVDIPLIGILPSLILVVVHFQKMAGTRTEQVSASTFRIRPVNGGSAVTLDTLPPGTYASQAIVKEPPRTFHPYYV